MLYRIVQEVAPSLRDRGCAIDEELEILILSCLQKEPGERPESAEILERSLDKYRGRAETERPNQDDSNLDRRDDRAAR